MRPGAAVAHADVVVLGTGAAGLVAALSARCAGAEVALLESTGAVGGTTALSGGTCWIPCNHHQDPAGPPDTRDDAIAGLYAAGNAMACPTGTGLRRRRRHARAGDHVRLPRRPDRRGDCDRRAGRRVRFGLVLPIQSTVVDLTQLWDQLVAEVVTAEEAGFQLVGLPEFHQARTPVLMSPMVLGAQLLAATTRIRFAPLVLCGPLHHPVRLAEEYAVLDWTSGGRAVLGIGVGHQPADLAAYGVDRDSRAARTDELLDVFTRCFEGEPFTHCGRFFEVDLAAPLPTPSGRRPRCGSAPTAAPASSGRRDAATCG